MAGGLKPPGPLWIVPDASLSTKSAASYDNRSSARVPVSGAVGTFRMSGPQACADSGLRMGGPRRPFPEGPEVYPSTGSSLRAALHNYGDVYYFFGRSCTRGVIREGVFREGLPLFPHLVLEPHGIHAQARQDSFTTNFIR